MYEMLGLQLLSQFAYMAIREWWSCGATWTYHFFSTVHNLPHEQIMVKVVVLWSYHFPKCTEDKSLPKYASHSKKKSFWVCFVINHTIWLWRKKNMLRRQKSSKVCFSFQKKSFWVCFVINHTVFDCDGKKTCFVSLPKEKKTELRSMDLQ